MLLTSFTLLWDWLKALSSHLHGKNATQFQSWLLVCNIYGFSDMHCMNHVCGRATYLLLKAGGQLFRNSPLLSSWWFFLQKHIHKGKPWLFMRMCSCKLLKDWVESGYKKKKCPLLYVAHDLRSLMAFGDIPYLSKCCMHLNSSDFMVWRNELVWWLRWGRASVLWANKFLRCCH